MVAPWEAIKAGEKWKEYYIPSKPALFDAWIDIEMHLGMTHNEPATMMATFWEHYDRLDRGMREGREPAGTYLAQLMAGVRAFVERAHRMQVITNRACA